MDSGNLDPELSQELAGYVERGGTVVSFLGDSVAGKLGLPQATKTVKAKKHAVKVSYQAPGKGTEAQSFDALGSSVGVYNLRGTQAEPILRRGDQVVGYQVAYGKGRLIQSGVNWSDIYDSPYYALIEDGNARTAMIQDVLAKSNLTPKLRISEKTDRITVTGRVLPSTQELMINVASYRRETQAVHVLLDKTLISEGSTYRVTNVLTGTEEKIKGRKLLSRGLSVKLGNSESAVFSLQVVK